MKFIIKPNTKVYFSDIDLTKDSYEQKVLYSIHSFNISDILVDPIGTYTKFKTISASSIRNNMCYAFKLMSYSVYTREYDVMIVHQKDVTVQA